MKIGKLVGDRFKEMPSDCVIDSHAYFLRGGYMKHVTSGIFSLYTPLLRITKKIEHIIHEEMNDIDGQEVMFPVVLPASLLKESGRYTSIGNELAKFNDRNNCALVLGMTHEEAAVQLVREYGDSYLKYPFMIYQIQTKFRDEARPRGGLIRTREFTMKDAYSFHVSQEDLDKYYSRCYQAYKRIFERVGIDNVLSVTSNSGIMGGNISHEFILIAPSGEDSIVVCSNCGYSANREVAENIVVNNCDKLVEKLKLVHTPDIQTIEDLCRFLNLPLEKSCKAIIYQKNISGEYVVVFIRGDMDVNETKLVNHMQEDIHIAVITDSCDLKAGFVGPYGIKGSITVLYDKSLEGTNNLVCGANIKDHHYVNLYIERDCGDVKYNDFAKVKEGGICPVCCKSSITISRGIEVGNIFQLGTKYTETMNMQYLDEEGNLKYPLMGCYGIGIGRLAASVCEEHHDENGPIWPISIAPWHVHLCCIRADKPEIKEYTDNLYQELQRNNIEVLYDDRDVSAGVMFSDADLLGIPIRVISSPRNLKDSCCEIALRDKTVTMRVPIDKVISTVNEVILKEARK